MSPSFRQIFRKRVKRRYYTRHDIERNDILVFKLRVMGVYEDKVKLKLQIYPSGLKLPTMMLIMMMTMIMKKNHNENRKQQKFHMHYCL